MKLQKHSISFSTVALLITKLVDLLKSESKDDTAKELYAQCVYEARNIEDGGFGLELPKDPRGWLRADRAETTVHLRNRLAGVREFTVEEIREYHM